MSSDSKPRLLHPLLHKLPKVVRFNLSGLVNNTLFLVAYAYTTALLSAYCDASLIYAGTYFAMIPIGHAVTCLFVFGWPSPYLPSLLSNVPVGLSAIVLGSLSTAYLERIEFDLLMITKIIPLLETYLPSFLMSYIVADKKDDDDHIGTFYSSIAVMVITGIWGYVLANIVNGPKKGGDVSKEKKEV